MDSMSYRNNRPTQRRSEAEPAATAPSQPATAAPPAPAASRSKHISHAAKQSKQDKKPVLLVGIIVAIVLLAFGAWYLLGKNNGASSAIDSKKYQAVFLSNEQVYFGKLQNFNGEYMKLKEIFYLQTQASTANDSENPQKSSTNQNNVQLIKLGDEIHGPEDEMIVSKDQILFFENLKSDSKVSQSIAKFKKPN